MTFTKYKRVLLKLTGELFGGKSKKSLDFVAIEKIAQEIKSIQSSTKAEIAVVIGAGNLFRGALVKDTDVDPATADCIGMVATVMNGLALQEALERVGAKTRLMSSLEMKQVCEPYVRRRAIRHIEKGRIVILSAGVGSPFFTTDTGAILRAIELKCDVVLKASNVNGIYDKDPNKHKGAKKYDHITYERALKEDIRVMDATAFALAQKEGVPIVVFNIDNSKDIERIISGQKVGTLVSA